MTDYLKRKIWAAGPTECALITAIIADYELAVKIYNYLI